MHANFFYKNIIWTGALFWFCIFNEWEATVSSGPPNHCACKG